MSDVLIVQPDSAQAETLREISHRVGAEFVIVRSTRDAIDAMSHRIPDLILLSTLLSPRDEDALMAHLRSLEGASHLQTLTIPQFRGGEEDAAPRKGLFGFRKKAKATISVGCDPEVFAEEVASHLKRAKEIRNRPAIIKPKVAAPEVPVLDPAEEAARLERESAADALFAAAAPIPARSSPLADLPPSFEHVEPTVDRLVSADEPLVAAPEFEPMMPAVAESPAFGDDSIFLKEPIAEAEASAADSILLPVDLTAPAIPVAVVPEVVVPQVTLPPLPEPVRHASVPEAQEIAEVPAVPEIPVRPVSPKQPAPFAIQDDDIDRLARELGLDTKLIEIEDEGPAEPVGDPVETFDFGAALDRARLEAEERREADLARMQLETEAIREAAIAEARAAAEREAREALAVDLARVQAEAEAMRDSAIAEAKAAAEREAREARESLDAELARVRSETEVTVADALNKVKLEAEEAERVRAEAERMRVEAQQAFAAELARVRAEVEQSLAAQLDAARVEAERMRAAEESAVKERAAVEAQLKAELDRLRFVTTQARKADESEARRATDQIKQLESELAAVRAKADERQAAQVQELRAQMAEMREAAAQHARTAAAEAVATEVARATAQAHDLPRRLNVVRMQPRALEEPEPARAMAAEDSTPAEESAAPPTIGADYYSLWQNTAETVVEPEDSEEVEERSFDFKRYAKWALPAAACLLLVLNADSVMSLVAPLLGPGEKPPTLIVEPVNAEPLSQPVDKRIGVLKVESTPAGADVLVGGRKLGVTPITIPDLEAGAHTVVIKSSSGTVTRKVTIKPNEMTALSEAIFSGWLAIFSPIPVSVVMDGKAVSLPEDGRLMLPPGRHSVELVSDRFNYQTKETLDVRPGQTTAYNVSVPMGSVRVVAPAGAEIKIDGQPAQGTPAEGLEVAIGSHEITATHPDFGERRVSVDVRQGTTAEVTF